MAVVTSLRARDYGLDDQEVRQARVDLAAVFRWIARLNMHEGIANHFSAAVSADGTKFLMNPRGRHFSQIRASELLLLDTNDPKTMERPDAPDPTAWCIHGRIHANLPQARCILHLHPKYSTALAALEDNNMYPIDQNTMRFYDRMAFDNDYAGMALSEDEGDRLSRAIGDKPVLMMANHGVLIASSSIGLAFDEMYYFERAAETLLTAYATGKKLRLVSDNIAKLTASQWVDYPCMADDHLNEIKAILDKEEPEYRS
jgi:ribulose-5-phosphate 4-epimerase/fuculose-1-phosphate aldolase